MRLIEEISDIPSEPEVPSLAATRAVEETLAQARSAPSAPSVAPSRVDGVDGNWCEPRGLTSTETAQMARLREKYAGHVVGRERASEAGDLEADASATEARLKAAQARMDAEFLARPIASADAAAAAVVTKIRVCGTCRGARNVKVEYNHRVMEQMCTTCDGEGVLQSSDTGGRGGDGDGYGDGDGDGDGDEKKADVSKAPPNLTRLGAASDSSPFSPGNASRRRLAVLLRDAKRLEKQIEAYRGELRDAQTRLDSNPDLLSGEEQALAELMHQLRKRIGTLRAEADSKREEASALGGSSLEEDE